MPTLCIQAIVTGTVQGVFYRDSTRRKAQSLRLTGWVKNLSDGTVELHACGEEDHIDALIAWLHEGPPAANVTQVDWSEIPEEDHADFTVR